MEKGDIHAIQEIVKVNFAVPDCSLIDPVTVEGIMGGETNEYNLIAINHNKAKAIEIFD